MVVWDFEYVPSLVLQRHVSDGVYPALVIPSAQRPHRASNTMTNLSPVIPIQSWLSITRFTVRNSKPVSTILPDVICRE